MKNKLSKAGTLTFSEKVTRLAGRLRDPRWRRYGMLLLAGKALGIAVLIGIITVGPALIRTAWDWTHTVVYAQQEAPASAAPAAPDPYKAATGGDIINPINTGW